MSFLNFAGNQGVTFKSFTSSGGTTYSLDVQASTNSVMVSAGGILQKPGTDYNVSGSTITTTSAITSGVVVDTWVIHKPGSAPVIQDNSISNAKMQDDAIGIAELSATGTPSAATFLAGNNAWTAVSSDFVKIQSTTCSGSGVEFDSSKFDNSTYSSYEFRFLNVRSSGNGDRMYVNTSTDGGSTWETSYFQVFGEWNTNAGASLYKDASESATHLQLGADSNTGNATNESMSGVFRLFNPGGTSHTHMNWHMSYDDDQAGEYFTNVVGSGKRPSAADVDGIKFFFGNNYDSGTIIMYGIK